MAVIAYANGFTLWHYSSMDTMAQIDEPMYFNEVLPLMNTGDIIIINAVDCTAIKSVVLDPVGVVALGKVQL